MRPLTPRWTMQKKWKDRRNTADVVGQFIKPNDRLTAFERLEIYNKQYWFRIVDSLYEDFPGVRAVLGDSVFSKMARRYLEKYPSENWTMRDLGNRLEQFLREEPQWARPHEALAVDMARFEWAQVEAFDNEARPVLTEDDILGRDPAGLRLELQPYVRLAEFGFPVDDFLLATKAKSTTALRGEASNAVETGRRSGIRRRARLPKPRKTWLAVHRVDNDLYYKKLELEAYKIVAGLRDGATLGAACEAALLGRPDPANGWPVRIQGWFRNWMSLGWFCRPGSER